MSVLLDPTVLVALLIALAVGFILGRMGRAARPDPSDFSTDARPAPGRISSGSISIPSTPQLEVDMPTEVLAALRAGKIINAIKALREAHPELGLKEAKDAVEAYVRRNGL